MNISSQVLEHDSAEHSVSAAPTPLRYTQVAIGLAALVCAVIQLIHGEAGDLYIGASLLGTAMTYYALRWSVLAFAPLSALTLIGCGLVNFFLPLALTTIEGKPVTFELQRPDLTFGFNLLALLVLIAAHFVYRQSVLLQGARSLISERVLSPLGVFIVPSPRQLFLLGAVGLGSTAFIYLVLGITTGETFGSVGLKLIEGMFFLTYAPYLVVLYPLFGARPLQLRSVAAPLVAYSLLVFMIGSARNSRTAVVVGFVGLGIGVLLAGWLGLYRPHAFKLSRVALVVIVAAVLLAVADRVSTAMLASRGERLTSNPAAVLAVTLNAIIDPESSKSVDLYRDTSTADARWFGADEYYLANEFFGRLCNLKFADNTLAIVADLDSSGRSEVAQNEWYRAMSILPQPLLSLLGSGLNKEAGRGSMGSFIYYLSSGRPEILDQLATGSFLASGWATFGFWFPCVLGFIGVALFTLLDGFSPRRGQNALASVTVAPVIAISLFSVLTVFTSAAGAPESLAGLLEIVVRRLPEQAIVYSVCFLVVRTLLPRGKRA